jgi:hypothetical protein
LPTGDPNVGQLSNVTPRRQVGGGAWSIVRQVQYAYYDGSQTYGNLGDLMTATVEDGSGNAIATSYYRYYTSGQQNGYQHALHFVFNPQSEARLAAAFPHNTLDSLTDAQVAPYADNAFQYDSSQRATQEVVQDAGDSTVASPNTGLGTYTYSYTASSNTPDFNSWAMKTVVTAPDGSTDTVYTNFAGEVMLDDHHDPVSNQDWDSFYQYNSSGQVILAAAPSAVLGYSDTYADLLNNLSSTYLSNTSGLIAHYDYYTSTTATDTTAGGVLNYQQDVQIQQGQQGALIPQETWQYYAHSFNGQTIAPVATDTVNRNTDGTGAQTTSFSYTWYSGTAQIQSETDTLPVISAAQNGPAVADVTTTFFDQFGNATWFKDGDGFITYDAYDAATGALVTNIDDVDTTKTSEFQNLPSGWSTPTGGGLNLITTDVVDALGRTTKETSPAGNVTYWIYQDPQYEVREYDGWTGTATTGPTIVYREDWANNYVEELTMTATPHVTGGAPDGTEAISGLQTLSRQYLNSAGQTAAAWATAI